MAVVLEEIAALTTYGSFIARVTAAAVLEAKTVGAEEEDPVNPERTQKRKALATNLLTSLVDGAESPYVAQFVWMVAANSATFLDSIDDHIKFVVNEAWDAIAGAPPATEP